MSGTFARCLRAIATGAILLIGTVTANAAGALAVGSCAAYGYAYDYGEEQGARTAALQKCNGSCKVVATIRRGCAAYAIDGQNKCGAHGYASAPTLGRAQNVALRFCYKYGGRDCMVRAWACDGSG
jgi:hypothetical protein